MSTSNREIASIAADPEFTFRFVEFDSHRHQRGLPAVNVVVIVDGVDDDVQWIGEKDIRNYLEIFGQHAALLTALAYYAGEIAAPQPEAA